MVRLSTLVLFYALLSVTTAEGRISESDRQLSDVGNAKQLPAKKGVRTQQRQRKKTVDEEEDLNSKERAKSKDSNGEKNAIVVDDQAKYGINDVCKNALKAQPGSIVMGNHDLSSLDTGAAQECVQPDSPGLWYHVNGTGKVLRASLVESNHTRIAVFKGSNCRKLECEDAIVPTLTRVQAREAAGWSTFFGTEPSQNYFIYLYGAGTFEMMLTEQRRPQNDRSTNPLELQIGTPLEGSTAFASPENSVNGCDSSPNNAGGVWFSINGTGLPLQAKLRNVDPTSKSQLSIYSDSFECVENLQHIEYFDANHPEWYPIFTAVLWDSLPSITYHILIRGRHDEPPGVYEKGSFELTILEHDRPENDKCTSATKLGVGQTLAGSTNFATLANATVCSPVALSERSTAPGVWFVVAGEEGRLRVSIASAYASQVTVFSGDSCDSLVCVEGTDNAPPDATDLLITLSSEVQWDATANETFYILVHGLDSMVGVFELTLSQLTAPPSPALPLNFNISEEPSAPTPAPTSQPKKTEVPKPEDNVPATATPTSTIWNEQISASLSFGFFPGTQVKSPSKDEVNALMDQASQFFSKVFQAAFDDAFIRLDATPYDTLFDDQSALPIVISFTTSAYFTSQETAPSTEDTFELMAGADFQDFIRNYAWQTEPFSSTVFFQTLRVVFGDAASLPANSAIDEDISQEEAVQRVNTKATMVFSFFPDAVMREPTDDEVNGLIRQIRAFFTKSFETQFDDFVRFGAIVTATNYTEGSQLPVEVSLAVSTFFSLGRNDNPKEIHTPTEILSAMEGSELTDFIQNYIWQSEPFSENIFYETMHVQVKKDDIDDVPEAETSPIPSSGHVLNEPDNAVVHVALSFSFHDTATTILRAPGPEEIDGLMNKTAEYFSELLLNELPDSSAIDEVNLVAASVDYKEMSEFSVVVYMRMDVKFKNESDANSRPTTEQILALMETANMNEYVEYYVWFSEPGGSVFFATHQVVLEPYVPVAVGTAPPSTGAPNDEAVSNLAGTVAPGGVYSGATTESVSLLPVETDVVAMFDFFKAPQRMATQDELDALTTVTTAFFNAVLKKVYTDLIRLDVELVTAGFAEEANEPSVVAWTVTADFYVLDGTGATRTPEHLLNVLTTADEEDYLHNYIWSAAPLGSNFFFDTSAVKFEKGPSAQGDSGIAFTATAILPSHSSTPSLEKVVVEASMQYGFLKDIVIAREPNAAEKDGIQHQTSMFFNKLFREHFSDGSFKQIATSIKDVTLVTGTSLPVIISYEFIAHFENAQSVPTSEELYNVMDDANFEEYIELYVWNAVASPDSMFFDTQEVVFQANLYN